MDYYGKVIKAPEEKKDDGKFRDAYGKEIKEAPKEEMKKEVKMKAGDKKLGDDSNIIAKH